MKRIWRPNILCNKDLWRVTGQEDINLEIRKRKNGANNVQLNVTTV
jgi:hypothetical protein